MLIVVPNRLSGIGQVMVKYSILLNATIVNFEDDTIDYTNQEVFIFALPINEWVEKILKIKKKTPKIVCMCVCETETVHPSHKNLFDLFETVIVPSNFCKRVFSKQFPSTKFEVVRHWESLPPPRIVKPNSETYTFYHIGNIIDHRKQINLILKAFEELNLPNSKLVLKATCNREVNQVNNPNVNIINGLLTPEQLDKLHYECDCYVSFSHSEGVGMGAVEAALRDKPVIITEFGGASEYIKSDFTIKCNLKQIGVNDFLYTKDMLWGDPSYEELKTFMKKAYDDKLTYVNHDHTRNLMNGHTIRNQLFSMLKIPTDPQ